MNTKILTIVLASGLLVSSMQMFAQEYNQAYLDSMIKSTATPLIAHGSRFMLTGYTTAGIKLSKNETSFRDITFNPIFLWKPAERIFVEVELATELEGDKTEIALEYANASFILNKYMTLRAGKFLSPFGIFTDRLHPGWINKLPTAPLGFGHEGVGPNAELGVDVRGGIPLGSSKMNYSFYVSNGPTLNIGDHEPEESGMLNYGNADDNNKNKAVGGRIGFLPLSNSSLEVGGSFQTGKVGAKETIYEDIKTQQYALDLSYVKQLDFIKGMLDVKGQWSWVNVDKADYMDTGTSTYTFDNKRNSLFIWGAYRPTMVQNNFLKKTELVFRYSALNPPGDSKEPEKMKQYMYGINYWLNWRTAFKLAYQSQENDNAFFLQVALSF